MNKIFCRHIICYVTLVLSLSLLSCGSLNKSQQADTYQKNAAENTMDKVQQQVSEQKRGYGNVLASYGVEIPVSRPSIYVNVTGYALGREKKAIFVGNDHGQTFDVVRCHDNEIVYTGIIPAGKKDDLSGQILSVADFTSLDEPGKYYIRTDIVGQSYSFGIAEDTYENLFLSMLKNVADSDIQESAERVCDVCFGMDVAMYALQCNGMLFEAAYEHLDQGEQDKQLVAQLLYMGKWLISRQQNDGSIYDDYEATAAFCGIMSFCRDMFGRYEASVGREYEQAAEAAWRWIERHSCSTDREKSARFYAAAQLFKSEGDEQYKIITEEYLREKEEDYFSERFVFYGVLAYISTEGGTDRDLCTYIMKDIVGRVEAICGEVKKDSFFGVGTRSIEENISNMLHLSFVSYLTPSKEYTIIIENTIQYMGGLNENGICYIGTDGLLEQSFEWKGIMLLSMSDMLRNFIQLEGEGTVDK